jgi:tetratricopeptide (TPR) repeat protein
MSRTGTRLRGALAALSLTVIGCAGPGVDVDDVLIDGFTPEDQATTILMPLAAFDVAASATRERAERADAAVAELVEASRSMFFAADARVQIAALKALEAEPTMSLAQLVDVDARAPDRTRDEVESLTRTGKRYAERALELDPGDAGALLYRGTNTVLLAWSLGKRRALFEGLGSTCQDATQHALDAGESQRAGAALRLRGRFLSNAPWPVGDQEEGLRLLRRSVEVAPALLNWLFLGDALYAAGDEAAARDAWQHATRADADDDTVTLAGYHQLLARERLAAAEAGR